jgi:hypothetical protein
MKGLAKEIGGNIVFENANGMKITILFEKDLLHDADQVQHDYSAPA